MNYYSETRAPRSCCVMADAAVLFCGVFALVGASTAALLACARSCWRRLDTRPRALPLFVLADDGEGEAYPGALLRNPRTGELYFTSGPIAQ